MHRGWMDGCVLVCVPVDSSQELAGQDRRWLGSLDSAGWLLMVRNCLRLAKTTAETICTQHRPVFLQGEYSHTHTHALQ